MFPPPIDLPPELFRLEEPMHPEAICQSASASVLEEEPESGRWRPESMAIVDREYGVGAINPDAGFDAIGIKAWHDAGFKGQDISIAVFDVEWFGLEWMQEELGDVQTHDCFAHPSCELSLDAHHPRFGFERGVHGIACAEIIRDIAPESELHLLRVLGTTSLENAVSWAIRNEIDIVSMSLSFFNESFYDGTGPVNAQIDRLRADDIVMVTSAGNYAEQHHQAEFLDQDNDGFHDFDDSRGLPVYYSKGTKRISLIWDQFQQCGRTDLNIYVWNRDRELVGRSVRIQGIEEDNCHPSEKASLQIDEDGWYFVEVELRTGTQAPRFDIMAKGGYLWEGHLNGSIVDPATHPSALTVGAVRVDNYLHSFLESFSSQGPTSNGLLKPDLVAPDGLSTQSYGPKNFFGTSASTPATAATLAVYRSGFPDSSNYDAVDMLKRYAIPDSEQQPFTSDKGHGRLRLPTPPDEQSKRYCATNIWGIPFLMLFLYRKNRSTTYQI